MKMTRARLIRLLNDAPARLVLHPECSAVIGCEDCRTVFRLAQDRTSCCGDPVGLETRYLLREGRTFHLACVLRAMCSLLFVPDSSAAEPCAPASPPGTPQAVAA